MPIRFRSKRTLLVCAVLAVATAVVVTAPLAAGRGGGDDSSRKSVKVRVMDAAGDKIGTVKLRQQGSRVVVRAQLEGLTPGFHGFHVHSVGECVPPFTSAGGHYNPAGTGHGEHAGDMPSLLVLDDGTAQLQFATDRFTVAELLAGDGSAIVVHALPDNFANIPTRYVSTTEGVSGPDSATLATGDAGGRFACGVVG